MFCFITMNGKRLETRMIGCPVLISPVADGIGNAQEGFERIAQGTACDAFHKSLARGIPFCRKNILYLLDRKLCAIAHLDVQLPEWRAGEANVLHRNSHRGELRRVFTPSCLIRVQSVIYQLFDDIDIPLMWWASGGPAQAIKPDKIEFAVK